MSEKYELIVGEIVILFEPIEFYFLCCIEGIMESIDWQKLKLNIQLTLQTGKEVFYCPDSEEEYVGAKHELN